MRPAWVLLVAASPSLARELLQAAPAHPQGPPLAPSSPLALPGNASGHAENVFSCPARHWAALEAASGGGLGRPRPPHKDLWPPSLRDYLTLALTAVALFIAAGGGIGGGGVLVPLYMLLGDFSTEAAVALSNVTILGGALSNFGFNTLKRHPYIEGRTLIDWDLILMMEPLTVLGALVGGYVNKVLPSWITTILLGALMTLLTWKLGQRAASTWARETHLHRQEEEGEEGGPGEAEGGLLTQPLLGRHTGEGAQPPLQAPSTPTKIVRARILADPDGVASVTLHLGRSLSRSGRRASVEAARARRSQGPSPDTSVTASPRPDGALEEGAPAAEGDKGPKGAVGEEAAALHARPPEAGPTPAAASEPPSWLEWGAHWRVPPVKLGLLLALFLVVLVCDLLKGARPCGSPGYWAITWLPALAVLAVSLAARDALVKRSEWRAAAGREPAEGDIAWDRRTTLVYPAICSLAGLVAGLFGVGGGIIKAPIMLELGVLPEVASATSATMIMFTAASASVVYLSFGAVQRDYGAALLATGLVVTLLGQVATHSLMMRLGRRSIIVWAMALLMLLSALISYYEAVLSTRSAVRRHQLLDWGHICG